MARKRTRRCGQLVALAAALLLSATACSHAHADTKPHGWTPTKASTDLLPTAAVSCPAAGFCVTVNALTAKEVTYNHGSWKVQTLQSSGELTTVSCVTKSFCMAVGGNEYLAYDGSSWGLANTVSPVTPTSLTSVSCVSTSFCVAVDVHSNSFVYNGAAWTSNPVNATGDSLTSVSCVSTQFCVTVGRDLIYVYNGTDWAVANTDLIGGPELDAVSCSGPTSCLAVGQARDDSTSGYEATFDGTHWTGGTVPGTGQLLAVSCPTTGFCVASSNDGHVQVTRGGSKELQTLDKGYSFLVSCTTDLFCLAIESTKGKAQTAQFDGRRGSDGG